MTNSHSNLDADTAAYVSTASTAIGALGAIHYFDAETVEMGRAHGLDGFRFYFYMRGGSLGDVEAAVVASAFGYFSIPLVTKMWTSARERADVSPREAGRLQMACAADVGRREFTGISGLEAFCAAAAKVVDAADPAGLALFAAVAAEPRVADPAGQAMQLLVVLREFRGSAHLVGVRAVGLDPKVAHGVRRPDFWSFFGYGDDEGKPQRTPEIEALMAKSEEITDLIVTPAYGVLDAAERSVLLAGLAAMGDAHAAAVAESKNAESKKAASKKAASKSASEVDPKAAQPARRG